MIGDNKRPKGQHGGRRAGAGRPKILTDDMILGVGWACEALQSKAYERKLAAAKKLIFEEITNLSEFFADINSMPIEERSEYLHSQEFKDHQRAIEAELKVLGQPMGTDGNPSRFLNIPMKRIYGLNEDIYFVVGAHFGLTRNQVKRCWKEYRKLNFWDETET